MDTLKGPGPFTVLAPTDEAFAKVPKATLDALAADPAKLKDVLLYHVIAGNVPSSEVVKLTSAKTLNGASVAIKVDGGSVFVNNAKVIIPDVQASNGVIHVIDTVPLLPAAKQNIVKTAVAAGQFKTLLSLVTKAGLAKTLSEGTWTVFAPTDAAFAKVPKATLAKLGKNPALLKKVLLYHVVKDAVGFADVTDAECVDEAVERLHACLLDSVQQLLRGTSHHSLPTLQAAACRPSRSAFPAKRCAEAR